MAEPQSARASRRPITDPLQVNLRWLVVVILLTVILPTTLLTGIGLAVILARSEALDLVFGVLVISFASSVIAGAVLLMILVRRGARLARIQETFLSHMGHELLTPLAGIRLHGDILGGLKLPADATASVDSIRRETDRLQTLVERILRWRRIRAPGYLYDRVPTTAQRIMERVMDLVRAPASLRVNLVEPDLELTADIETLAEAIANLVHNSLKYAGERGTIVLTARRILGTAVFAVADRGPGLPPGQEDRLFDPFFRFVPRQRPDPGGSGLGLTIADQIARAHGGRLTAADRPGGGARFAILIPLRGPRR